MKDIYHSKWKKVLNSLTCFDAEKLLSKAKGGKLIIPTKIDGIRVEAIANGCFNGVVGIKEIIFPPSVIYVQHKAIINCDVERIVFSKNLDGIDVFQLRTNKNLKCIDVEEGCPNYKTIQGSLYSGDGSVLYYACSNTIDENTNTIGIYSFSESDIESVIIPEKVSEISNNAFSNCKNLENVQLIGGNLKLICDSAFEYCKKLKHINIPGSVTTIGDMAFKRSGLKELIFEDRGKKGPKLTIGMRTFINTDLFAVDFSMVNQLSIGFEAFKNSNVAKLTLSGNINIQTYSFYQCYLEEITFKSVTLTCLSGPQQMLGVYTDELLNLIKEINGQKTEVTYIRHNKMWISDRFW